MANQEYVELLKQGVDIWNRWREEYPDIQPDLSFANFVRANLVGANLSGADLSGVSFHSADLSRADLSRADLSGAHLSEANLSGANLIYPNLIAANLSGADLSHAHLRYTVFAWVDLRMVKGLDTIVHNGPSSIDVHTVELPQGDVLKSFLCGTGFSDTFIDYLSSLLNIPIQYQSCFVSYSSKDDAFASKLYANLQECGVRCWFAPEDLKWGERIHTGIDEAIRLHDKLLLILSKSSVTSGWVEREVKAALAKERKEKRIVLFPVRVDRAVFESPFAWATEIRRKRNIGDFTCWKDHDEYQKAFTRLLRDLQSK